MSLDDLDERMRVFETAYDLAVLPGIFMVARLDGRSFTRLTKELHAFERPFDVRFRDLMVDTAAHLMECGFDVRYAYVQSDEISLYFDPNERAFGRSLRKYHSVLAGEASARFSNLLGDVGVFDARVSQLTSFGAVMEYFRWRQEDAARNALNGHCYWMLRNGGATSTDATARLSGLTVAAKNELLFQAGVNFNDLPGWQKRGVGLHWENYEKSAVNGLTGAPVVATRRRIGRLFDLPFRDEYVALVERIVLSDV